MSARYILKEDTRHLVLCEGRDAERFLVWVRSSLVKDSIEFESLLVHSFGGNSNLENELGSVQVDRHFSNLRSISVFRDAEQSALDARDSVRGALYRRGFAVPDEPAVPTRGSNPYSFIATGYMLFPSCTSDLVDGTLEDLCLNILAGDASTAVLASVDKALEPYVGSLRSPHKNRLHSYFSFTNEFVTMKLGEAARAKAFSENSPQIASIRTFLIAMLGASGPSD